VLDFFSQQFDVPAIYSLAVDSVDVVVLLFLSIVDHHFGRSKSRNFGVHSVPDLLPDLVPDSGPDSGHDSEPDSEPDSVSDSEPDSVSDSVPNSYYNQTLENRSLLPDCSKTVASVASTVD
jgi:hypothetical protein